MDAVLVDMGKQMNEAASSLTRGKKDLTRGKKDL
jgi:hypothetical protein